MDGKELEIPSPVIISPRHYYLFLVLFNQCILEGYSCKEARDYANLELTGKLFHLYDI